MKAWLEEYGLIIVGIIVVAALVALAVYTSSTGQKKAAGAFNGFTNKADGILNENDIDTSDESMGGSGGSDSEDSGSGKS